MANIQIFNNLLKIFTIFYFLFPQYLWKSATIKRGRCVCGGTQALDTDQAPRSHGLPPPFTFFAVVANREKAPR